MGSAYNQIAQNKYVHNLNHWRKTMMDDDMSQPNSCKPNAKINRDDIKFQLHKDSNNLNLQSNFIIDLPSSLGSQLVPEYISTIAYLKS